MIKVFTNLLLLMIFSVATSQESASKEPYYIDVLIDSDRNIYFEDSQVNLDRVAEMTRKKVEKLPFVLGKKIIYRIYGDRNLILGDIMDVEQKMKTGFSDPYQARRYLLETRQIPLDKDNWVEQLNKLDLKAIDENKR